MKLFSAISFFFVALACQQAYSMVHFSSEKSLRTFRCHHAKFKTVLAEMRDSPRYVNNFFEPADKQPRLLQIQSASRMVIKSRADFKKKLHKRNRVLPSIIEEMPVQEQSRLYEEEDRQLFSPRIFKCSHKRFL